MKQTVKTNNLDDEHNERTEETIKKAEKDFALDLPMIIEETAKDTKILSAITAVEKNQIEEIFYPYRPYRHHLTTRFALLFYNDKIVIPEAMRSTIIAMLHQGHPSATKDGPIIRSLLVARSLSGDKGKTGKLSQLQVVR